MAKYRDIADDLRRRIAAGEFPVGSRLPGIPALQERYDAALGTVRAAEDILRDEGLLRTAQGEGSFVLALPEPAPADVLGKLRDRPVSHQCRDRRARKPGSAGPVAAEAFGAAVGVRGGPGRRSGRCRRGTGDNAAAETFRRRPRPW